MSPEAFYKGLRVRYVPGVAYSDVNHKACEDGTVSSAGPSYVFVKFDKQLRKFGWDGTTSQACKPEDLVVLTHEHRVLEGISPAVASALSEIAALKLPDEPYNDGGSYRL